MSKKTKEIINELTPEQEAQIPIYRDTYRAIGLSTAPTDRTKAENAVLRSYAYFHKLNGLCSPTPEIIWCGGPFEGMILAAKYAAGSATVTNEMVQAQAQQASFGSFDAYWVSTYAYIAEQLPVDKDELIDIAIDIVKECGIYFTFFDLVIMTSKPTEIHMNGDNLHNETGPAIAYPNGDKVYAINGEPKNSLMEVVTAARAKKYTNKVG